VGTPVVPGRVRNRIEAALRNYDDFGECLYCWCLKEELHEGIRIVRENESFVAFAPYAALTPFHLWIFPRRHNACFGNVTDSELSDLASILKEILLRIYVGLDNPDLNYVTRSLSPDHGSLKYFHWYVSIVPRLSTVAGFELGTGMFINTVLPEQSAEFLRELKVPPPGFPA
jgi:UDPglucose--hexose-1-phosphate uridylyltransferase